MLFRKVHFLIWLFIFHFFILLLFNWSWFQLVGCQQSHKTKQTNLVLPRELSQQLLVLQDVGVGVEGGEGEGEEGGELGGDAGPGHPLLGEGDGEAHLELGQVLPEVGLVRGAVVAPEGQN